MVSIRKKEKNSLVLLFFIFFLFEFGGFCDFSGLIIIFHSNNSYLGFTYR
ncbi:hypothetical protein AtEden1_Chr5g0141031 [Arabidopsis thaliana]